MKKTFITICLIIYYFNSIAQIKDQKVINKWVSAVVNLECVSSSYLKKDELFWTQYRKKIISREQYFKKLDSLIFIADVNHTSGSAIYLKYFNHHYLISARHVLNDSAIDSMAFFNKVILVNDAKNLGKTSVIDRNLNMVSDESNFLMLYGSYIFSSVSDDIGIICLDTELDGIRFWKTLDKRGYVPIEISDIDEYCKVNANDKIISIGYTQDFSLLGVKNLPYQAFAWQSILITYPIVTNGLVADKLINKNYFLGDIFVYHGNSGGPAILKNKLVGIVHGPDIQRDSITSTSVHYYGLYHTKFMKSSLILPLLNKLESGFFGTKIK